MGFRRDAVTIVDKVVSSLPFGKLPTFCDGYWFWLPKNNWSTIYYLYEPLVANAIRSNLKPGDTFWDIGANIGLFSLFAAKLTGHNGSVFSFEPAPHVFNILLTNTQGLATIKAVRCGVGNEDTVATFASQGTSAAGSFIEDVTKLNESWHPDTPILSVEVNMRKADSLLKEFGSCPNLVKIDVEGFEVKVLKGAEILLSTIQPILIVEIHPDQIKLSGDTEGAIFEILTEHRYNWKVFDEPEDSIYHILAKPASSRQAI